MLTKPSEVYKPFKYPWADTYRKDQLNMFWIPDEVPMDADVFDWNNKLTDGERNLLTQIFRFFTQGDADIADAYCNVYLKHFKNAEIQRMMATFAMQEGIHIEAYSLLLETVGMPEIEYQAFKDYKEMADKHDYCANIEVNGTASLAKSVAIFSAFVEGMQLFSSFAILLSFPKRGLMTGMGQIVSWSVRDESLHVEAMTKVFRQLVVEHPRIVNDEFKKELYDVARKMVELEDNFINLAFELGDVEGITKEEVKQYIRYIANRRLVQLGLKPNWDVPENPLPWVDAMVAGEEHANFFEQKATSYSKAGLEGDWGF